MVHGPAGLLVPARNLRLHLELTPDACSSDAPWPPPIICHTVCVPRHSPVSRPPGCHAAGPYAPLPGGHAGALLTLEPCCALHVPPERMCSSEHTRPSRLQQQLQPCFATLRAHACLLPVNPSTEQSLLPSNTFSTAAGGGAAEQSGGPGARGGAALRPPAAPALGLLPARRLRLQRPAGVWMVRTVQLPGCMRMLLASPAGVVWLAPMLWCICWSGCIASGKWHMG